MQEESVFPVDVLPAVIRNAVYEVSRNTQAPISLIAASALGVISLGCQNRVDVCRLKNLRSPVSLFLLTIAESGERKSTVDKLFMQPLYEYEERLFEQYSQEMMEYNLRKESADAEKKAIISKLKSNTRRDQDTSVEHERLQEWQNTYPKEPVRYKLILNDATPAAIKDTLCGQWRSMGIMSDEAGTVFNGYTLNELPFINKMWDGSNFSVERKNKPERLIKDARLTVSLMVQPDIFTRFIERKGNIAKGSGFFARCLICKPCSTQGRRQITNPVVSNEHLPLFHKRLLEIVDENIARNSEDERLCLYFSPEAEAHWIRCYNRVESEMSSGLFISGSLSDFKDYASKAAENVARISALLHYFNGEKGDISLVTVKAAASIIAWYINEYKNLFSKDEEPIRINSDADELYQWIRDYCFKKLETRINKNTILQFGPNRFRSRDKTDELLTQLLFKEKIRFKKIGKRKYIEPVNVFSLI
ncbi:YfjI family protein [Pectobacterium brasiliense]|uniref:YfjI family protein n=1 Tax=Pectobacterium brasiliense TaxID=180957 RepID=UPI0025A0E5FC|nr:YfjI family protein [Pectobacterium brasiliense]WJM79880.1 YfjI family protein [Pectobacterium brasiliense]